MNINGILFNISLVFLVVIFIVVIILIRQFVLFWLEVKKAVHHYRQLEPKLNEIAELMLSIETKTNEIENTPLIQPTIIKTAGRYGNVVSTVMKSQSKYRMKQMKKQEKKMKKRLKHLKKQTKTYRKDKVKGSQTYGK